LCIPSHVIWTEDNHGKVTKEATGFLNDEGIGSHEEVDIPVLTAAANLLIPDDLQEEEDECDVTSVTTSCDQALS